MTYQEFKEEETWIAGIFGSKNLNDLTFAELENVCHEYRDLVNTMLTYLETINTKEISMNEKIEKDIEQKLLRATRGVFKYMTISSVKGYVSYTSNKNEFVQVGYLDLNNNIVFDEVKRPAVDESDTTTITRYLPGFHVRGYRSCEEYIHSLTAPSHVTKEIREVISTTTIQYNPSKYGTDNQEAYSVTGFLDENNVFIQYSQIIEDKS